MDQVLAIRAFSRVVDTGSFTKAAESLRMPKATVSKLVQTLEAHLGVQLLSRTTRRVAVTAEGLAYYEKSTRIVKELEDIDASFASTKGRPRGHLRVEVGSSVASRILVPALPSFLQRYPEVRVDVGVSDRSADLLADNVDCAIRGGPVGDTALTARTIGRSRWVTCATPAYLQKFGTPRRPRDLAQHRVVNYVSARTGRVLPLRFMEKRRPFTVEVRHTVGVNESNAHFAAGLAGLGIVQTFAFLAEDAIHRGEIVSILTAYQPPDYLFHAAYPPNRYVSNRLRAFIDWTVEVFAALR